MSRREVEEYLAENPLQARPAPTTRKRRSDTRWKRSTTNTRVQTFDAQTTPCSTSKITNTHIEDTINVATEPLTPPISPPLRVQKSAVQTQKPTEQVSVVSETEVQFSLVTSTQPSRKIFNKSPRTMITTERTRTVFSKQVPIIRATDADLVIGNPVTPAEAHSPVPELLFRFYDDVSQGVRTRDGEICGRYAYQPCGPPSPLSCDDDRLFVSALSHLNKDETASELVSTTSNLFFAMKLAANSNANPHICVIRGSAMPSRKIFHLQPYHKRIKELRYFFGANYRNPSSHEYAVWATIPCDAILYDFSFADLERHLIGNPYMASIFRIDKMRTGKSNKVIQKGFQEDNLDLNLSSIDGIAKLMPYFGITVKSPALLIARLVSEIIRSFVISLPNTTQWDMLGAAFAYALSCHSKQTHLAETDLVRVKVAFLSGARSGCGKLNWHLDSKKRAAMIKKARSLGLGVDQIKVDTATLESTKEFQRTVAQFAYKEKDVNPDQDGMMDEDDTLTDDDEDEDEDEDEDKDEDDDKDEDYTPVENEDDEVETTHKEHIETNIEVAETDVEEAITVKTPPSSQRSPRDARQSSNKPSEPIIISDSSDDEDHVANTDNEVETYVNETRVNKPVQPGPRLSQQMLSSANTDDRRRRRSSRRRTQTPPIYNFSRADDVHYITDQSDDENYVDVEGDNDDMEL
jgi:hypothetical protein